MDNPSILLMNPEDSFRDRIAGLLNGVGYHVESLHRALELSPDQRRVPWKLMIVDDQLFDQEVSAVFGLLKIDRNSLPVVVTARQATVQQAVKAIHDGAKDYLPQSSDDQVITACIERVMAATGGQPSGHNAPKGTRTSIITSSVRMQSLLETAARVAPSDATVLLQGESGTGKEMLARFIHMHSGRRNAAFVAMNCAALPETLAESELFGFEKGSFTGAVGRKAGKFEQAHGGTLLLDEISEMPVALQPKLLRVLQEKNVERLGGRQSIAVDTRIIATTNRHLANMVKAEQFRGDLYYRLRVIPLEIPPLRERREDIPALIDHFIQKYCPDGRQLPCFTDTAMEKMLHWPWPGNIRELENTVQRAVLISPEQSIGPQYLLLDSDLTASQIEQTADLIGMTVKELEKKLIEQTLCHVNQNRTQASQMLGISIRTLRNKLREYAMPESECCALSHAK
jgi:DNA-binding NtrC family response regulator